MKISIRWLNEYLKPGDVSAADAEAILMDVGFPSESRDEIATPAGPDVRLDVEITSNRGDCLSVIGLAREVAARTGRTLLTPAIPAVSAEPTPASHHITIDNRVPDDCPLFTARVIRGVKIGPSPAWLRDSLEAVGQRSINNVVDVTNYINFELGNPCHAFDLAKLAGKTLIIRSASDNEPLTTLDGKKRTLKAGEIVVADAERATSLAGVIGGGDSEVSATTTDVVLEMATWNPAAVRRASRRHQVRTDASHRFERYVDARTIEFASRRAAALIAQVSGGRLCEGVVAAGRPLAPLTQVRFRPSRCRGLIGVSLDTDEMVQHLRAVGLEVNPIGRAGEDLLCTIPPHRHDLTREVDLIEEVARIKGLAAVPIREQIAVTIKPPQSTETARRELASLLTGLGFYETVTISFTTPKEAALFGPPGFSTIEIDDERRGGEPALRPSVLTGLLACRRKNQHAHVHVEGGVRLFETASVFAQVSARPAPQTIENTNLALLLDAPAKGKSASITELQSAVRTLRGSIEACVRAMAGAGASLTFTPAAPHCPAFDPAAYSQISLNGAPLGYLGLLTRETQSLYDLATPVIGAELNLPALLTAYPPKSTVAALPAFPGIERDISLVVAEPITWAIIAAAIDRTKTPPLEGFSFVTTYRGSQLGKGKKSVTVRLSFRDPARTLKHEEVDAPVKGLVDLLKRELNADLRA